MNKIPTHELRVQAYKHPDFKVSTWYRTTNKPAEDVFKEWGALQVHKITRKVYGLSQCANVDYYFVLLADGGWRLGSASPKAYKPLVRLSFDPSVDLPDLDAGEFAVKMYELQMAENKRDDAKREYEEAAALYAEAEERVSRFKTALETELRGIRKGIRSENE